MEEVGRNKYKIDDEANVNAFNGPIYPPNTLDFEKMKTMDEKDLVDYV